MLQTLQPTVLSLLLVIRIELRSSCDEDHWSDDSRLFAMSIVYMRANIDRGALLSAWLRQDRILDNRSLE
ncbi:protein of unknown function [Candidatus Nitrospira inopinata]|uniref:Uncharacterized protein n=1 Tax=Candidatus Nitrospira inopinata TaxID=1715989 RepID=A0A0S4KW16_9BACT|nr:protein of unknown function [Candidatus Nitrospira inopinata]